MKTRKIAGMAVAAALAGGVLTAALPAAAAAEPDTITITGSKLIAPWKTAQVFLVCPDSHPYRPTGVVWGYTGPLTNVSALPYGYPGYTWRASFFFNNGSAKEVLATAWVKCTTVVPS